MSSWTYYNKLYLPTRRQLKSFNETNPDFIGEIEEFLETPHELMDAATSTTRILQRNPQFVFFGYPSFYLKDQAADGDKGFYELILQGF